MGYLPKVLSLACTLVICIIVGWLASKPESSAYLVPGYDAWWLPPMISLFIGSIALCCKKHFTKMLSLDLIENCDFDNLKETMKNTFNNMALISALILTLNFSMLQQGMIEARWQLSDQEEHDTYETKSNFIEQLYISFTLLSIAFNTTTIMKGIFGSTYLEPLTQIDAFKYFLFVGKSLMGDTIIYMEFGFASLLMSTTCWIVAAYGYSQGALTLIFGVAVYVVLFKAAGRLSRFNATDNSQWDWIMDETEQSWPQNFRNEKGRAVLKRIRGDKKMEHEQSNGRKPKLHADDQSAVSLASISSREPDFHAVSTTQVAPFPQENASV